MFEPNFVVIIFKAIKFCIENAWRPVFSSEVVFDSLCIIFLSVSWLKKKRILTRFMSHKTNIDPF